MTSDSAHPRPRTAGTVAVILIVASAVAAIGYEGLPDDHVSLFAVGIACAAANVFEVAFAPALRLSAVSLVVFSAAVVLGSTTAIAATVVAVSVGFAYIRGPALFGRDTETYAPVAALINAAALGVPATVVGLVVAITDAHDASSLVFAAWVALASGVGAVANGVVLAGLVTLRTGAGLRGVSTDILKGALAPGGIDVVLTVVVALAYAEAQTAGIVMAAGLAITFWYMSRLLVSARDEAARNRAMSWGVLSALVHTLDARDSGTARHCAAVAMFSQDVARELGLSETEQELAHTAGLLHDIGKFALSDRILGGAPLLDEDWQAIREHPAIGATLLADLSSYGPVADIVRSHHERVDGFGYPDGLVGDEIPLVARIVAACEVYDTLTANDTYREEHSSFEAMRELRRVAGSQLDESVVDAVAELLAGRGVDYRHATAADFDRELGKKALTVSQQT